MQKNLQFFIFVDLHKQNSFILTVHSFVAQILNKLIIVIGTLILVLIKVKGDNYECLEQINQFK